MRVLARVVDAKDPSTRRHSERVADLAVRLATALGWSTGRCAQLHEAGLLHDVGKIGIPDDVLFKPGRLTAEEYEVVTTHAALGAQMLEEVVTPSRSPGSAATTSASTAAATRTGSPARRSPTARACSRWPTPAT